MKPVTTINPAQVFARFTPVRPATASIASASGQNTRIVEESLLGNPDYSHSWLINLDAVPVNYGPALKALCQAHPNGLPITELNGFNVVIKVRVNVGEPEPLLPMRGEKVRFVMTEIVSKEGEVLTHNKNTHLAGKPIYEVRRGAYSIMVDTTVLSWDTDVERDSLPTAKTESPAEVKPANTVRSNPF